MSSDNDDDAQRNLEQKALRNVRALVDKIENTDDHDREAVRSHALKIAAVVAVIIVVVGVAFWAVHKPEPPRTLVLPPPGAAPK